MTNNNYYLYKLMCYKLILHMTKIPRNPWLNLFAFSPQTWSETKIKNKKTTTNKHGDGFKSQDHGQKKQRKEKEERKKDC